MTKVKTDKEKKQLTASSPTIGLGHKFCAISEHLYSNLENSQIYFSSPQKLNDPFDCHIDLKSAFKRGITPGKLEQNQIDKICRGILSALMISLEKIGVFSVSAGKITETLMWAHYAKNHSGVCLSYEFTEDFVNGLIGVGKVEYSDNSITEFIKTINPERLGYFQEFIQPLVTKALTAKAPAWKYEDEFRIARQTPGTHEISRDFLRQVTFGLQTPELERRKIIQLVQKSGYQNCQFAEIVRTEKHDFGIEIVKMNI